ncbi:hypothetical protein OUZ56_004070 [Daphnia magna]|uniref:Uncharacterized protein n=1 Tax=Daphnia magna TaxID=35525 RepID=A0ABQ9YNN4_9CRUS|nr:hypothetical protein OUZ56_004070 [Daphnia magna]
MQIANKRARLDKIYEQRKQCEKRKELAGRTVESYEKLEVNSAWFNKKMNHLIQISVQFGLYYVTFVEFQ